jgi:hypothetical protein
MTTWQFMAAAMIAAATSHGFAQAQKAPASLAPGEVNVVGCVEMEKDYRARTDKGRGGPLGSGVGVGNEYVLTGVKAAPNSKTTATVADVYSLTGKLEPEFVRQIGRQVEVVGKLDEARTGEPGKLPKLTASLWHPFQDVCPQQAEKGK